MASLQPHQHPLLLPHPRGSQSRTCNKAYGTVERAIAAERLGWARANAQHKLLAEATAVQEQEWPLLGMQQQTLQHQHHKASAARRSMLAMLSCATGAAVLPALEAAAAAPAPPLGPSPPPLPAGPLPVPPLTETFISEEGFRFDYPAGW